MGKWQDKPVRTCGMVKDALANTTCNFVDGALELLGDGLAFEGLNSVRSCCGRHDDECYDGSLRT
jgi:hypothetical protein